MSRTVTRWHNTGGAGGQGAKGAPPHAQCYEASLQLGGGAPGYITFPVAVDRVLVFSDTAGAIAWRASNTTVETMLALTTAGGSPGAVTADNQGYRYLPQNGPGEVLEFVGGATHWHFLNHGGTTIVLRCEAGIAAGPNE